MKSFRWTGVVTVAVALACTASVSHGGWGPSRGGVEPAGFYGQAYGGCSDCDGGGAACDSCGGCDSCGACEDACACNECYHGGCCLLPNLVGGAAHVVGGAVHVVGGTVHWLFCCESASCCADACCDGGCGGGCDACAGDAGFDSGTYDLVPAPEAPKKQQANPFKDDTVSVMPRRRTRPAGPRNYWGVSRRTAPARPAVTQAGYAEPHRAARRGPRHSASGSRGARLSREQKRELLEALRQALE